MLSETLVEGLNQYRIGAKLRRLRLKKSMGLVELGKHSGLSPAMISKIERGLLYPTLPTLLRLSLVFSVGLDHFFSDTEDRPVFELTRKDERQLFPSDPESDRPLYHFESLDFKATDRKLTAYLSHFDSHEEDPDRSQFHSHDGIEFLYLIRGRLKLCVGDDTYQVDAGDSIYFDASVPHFYERMGKGDCAAVVVTVP